MSPKVVSEKKKPDFGQSLTTTCIGVANSALGRYDAARNFTENQEVNDLCPFQKLCAEW
jgi:hypothetical protein